MSKAVRIVLGALFVLLLAVAGVCALALTKPDEFLYARSIVINAPAAQIFPHVSNAKDWEAWTPWKDLDPDMAVTYEGPLAGIGSVTRWKGNANAGEGSMTMIEMDAPSRIAYRLDFIKPMPGTAMATFTFDPEGSNATKVTWSMSGENGFPGKVISVFMDCEAMMNEQFDKGLARLKAVVETGAAS